jgi:hypothetical protein
LIAWLDDVEHLGLDRRHQLIQTTSFRIRFRVHGDGAAETTACARSFELARLSVTESSQ